MKIMKSLSLLAVLAIGLAAGVAQAHGVDVGALFTPEVAAGLAGLGAAGTINGYQKGDIIDYVAGADISAGDVVKMGNILGVALVDIANGATGSVATRGVFTVPKVTAAEIVQGDALTWDVSAGKFDDKAATPATGDVTGPPAVAWEAGTTSMTELKVMFTGVPGTVT